MKRLHQRSVKNNWNSKNQIIFITSSPADSRPLELSSCYLPLPLRLGRTSPFPPNFPFNAIFLQQLVRNRLLDLFPKKYEKPLKTP